MDTTAYANLLDIALAGLTYALNVKAFAAFMLCLIFIYTSVAKDENCKNPLGEILWVSASVLCSFVLTSIALFSVAMPMTSINMTDLFMETYSLASILCMLSSILLALVAVWLYLPNEKKEVVEYYDETDLSAASFVAVLFGVTLSTFVFIDAPWPESLTLHAQASEALQQGVFYAFIYMLSFSLVWSISFVGFYILVGRKIVMAIPRYIGPMALIAVALFQIFQDIL